MDNKAPGILSLVLVPAIITLIVSVLRLVGELQGWGNPLVDNHAPGHEDQGLALLGASWLIFIFGLWFGLKIRKSTGEPAHIGKTALKLVLAFAITMGGFFLFQSMGLIVQPSAEEPGEMQGLVYMMGLLAVSAVITLIAWPRLAITLLVYGLLARIPVVVITYLAWGNDEWDTHYTKLPAGVVAEGNDALMALIMPQLTVWIVFTMMAGGLLGCLGAVIAGKKSS